MINDPCLTFPVFDCDEELDIYSESNTSGIANSWANGDKDDNLSNLLSASQIGTIGTMVGESDLQLFSEASCAHSVRLSMATSHLSDYFSEEDGNKSSESLIFTCEEHSLQYTDINDFEEHQVNFHTVNGRFLCGLCDRHYASKYLRQSHIQGAHLGAKFVCSIQNCGKKFSQKKYRDVHERSHNRTLDTNLHYVCDYCNSVFDQMERLQQHKLMHSSTKKYICKYCKVHGYTRSGDCKGHEDNCDMNPANKENPEAKHSASSRKKVTKKKRGPHQKLTYGHKPPIAKTCPENIFQKEIVTRRQPSRDCKNGTDVQGFYKTTSPASKGVKSSSSGSGQLAVLSPKPSVKGKFKCQFCVQHFGDREKLLNHIDALHSKKSRYACTRCKVTFADNAEFKVHMRQHQSDDVVEVKRSRLNDGQKRRK